MSISLSHRENMFRTVRFEKPDYIPMTFAINPACWQHYPHEALFELMASHPFLFPGFELPKQPFTPEFALAARKDHPYTDDFGCVWETTENGILGAVTKHPLADWDAFKTYQMPDPRKVTGIGPINWEETLATIESYKKQGLFVSGGLRHGHTFLQLCDLRGYENLLFDMVDEVPLLDELIAQLEAFNHFIITQYADAGVDMICYAEDLGMQNGPMLSPTHFKRYIKPSYKRLMQLAKDKEIMIHMHSDGHLHALVDDLIDGGVEILNLQDLVNGIDWIKTRLKGKVCIDLDIDRQKITPYGTPQQVEALIREEVTTLGSPSGGLMMIYGLYPGVPLANIKALMDAMEKYAFYYN